MLRRTTHSVDEAGEITGALRRRFPPLLLPRTDDICYATQNRQDAVRRLSSDVELWHILGPAEKMVFALPEAVRG